MRKEIFLRLGPHAHRALKAYGAVFSLPRASVEGPRPRISSVSKSRNCHPDGARRGGRVEGPLRCFFRQTTEKSFHQIWFNNICRASTPEKRLLVRSFSGRTVLSRGRQRIFH